MTATKTNKIDEITEQLEQGVKNVFESAEYKAYLEFVSKFYDYSINNVFLIFMQMPTATHVAGFKAWQDKFKRHVKKGEKGIKILAPCPHKVTKEVEDENGNKTEKEIQYTTYRAVSVFDISQTEGEDVPSLTTELTGDVADFATTYKKLESLSPVPVGYEEIKSGAKGYYSPSEKRIAINSGMADVQTLKTLVHEIAHAKLHDEDGEEKDADRGTKEVQAESVAYIVCNELGLDTLDVNNLDCFIDYIQQNCFHFSSSFPNILTSRAALSDPQSLDHFLCRSFDYVHAGGQFLCLFAARPASYIRKAVIASELDAYYRALDCSTIDIVERKIGRKRFDIMCDDEGLFKDPQKISAIDNLGRPMLVGNLMFFNNDGKGNLTGLSSNDINYIMKRIIHMYTHQYPKGYKMLTQCEIER